MQQGDDPQAFLAAATKAFEAETKSAKAILQHAGSCRHCQRLMRWRALGYLLRCRELNGLMLAHIESQVAADLYRVQIFAQQTDEWLENLYKLE